MTYSSKAEVQHYTADGSTFQKTMYKETMYKETMYLAKQT